MSTKSITLPLLTINGKVDHQGMTARLNKELQAVETSWQASMVKAQKKALQQARWEAEKAFYAAWPDIQAKVMASLTEGEQV